MDDDKKTIDYMLRSTWQLVSKMYNEQAQKYGSTMAVGFTLLSIDPEHGSPSTSLGPRMGVEATSLSRILKSMEENDLIYRKPNPNDGRGVLIFLTEEGLKNREISKATVFKFNETVKNNISNQKLKHFFEVTQKISELISEKEVFQD
jgi:DNA-binding MarR family transcriptional regulator